MLPRPVQTYLMILVALVTRDQLEVSQFTLRKRRRLAEFGGRLRWRRLAKHCSLVTPATLYAWHRRLIANKYDSSAQRKGRAPGRPPVADDTRKLVLRLALQRKTWGYRRISDVANSLGCAGRKTTVANLLQAAGIEPSPARQRGMTWPEFLRTHLYESLIRRSRVHSWSGEGER